MYGVAVILVFFVCVLQNVPKTSENEQNSSQTHTFFGSV